MNILCVSDLIDPLIYNSNAHNNFPDVDVILCAGDLPMDYIDFIVSVFNKPTYFIFGNHDLKEFHYYHGKRDTITHSNSNPNNGIFSSPTCEATNLEFNHGAIYAGFKNLIPFFISSFESPSSIATPTAPITSKILCFPKSLVLQSRISPMLVWILNFEPYESAFIS